MRLKKIIFGRGFVTHCMAIAILAIVRIAPPAGVACQPQTLDKSEQKEKVKVDKMQSSGFGRFVSFKDDALTVESNAGENLTWGQISEIAKVFKFDAETNDYKTVEGAASALRQVKAGTYIQVGDKRSFIRIGARHDEVIGSFVSFKNERLLMLGKNLPDSFTKRYGNNLHYSRFRDDVPVHESVDSGEYKLIGTANKILSHVKEGTIVTVHGEGDDNITLVQIGRLNK